MSKSLIVQKYGGSSLDSPERIKVVARKIEECARARNRIIVIVSAMGTTTDTLLSLAHDISPHPPRRELDMLLTVGERISMALLSMALNDCGIPAISFTGSQSGIVTNMNHTGAIIEEIRADRILEALDAGKVTIVAGFQGVSRNREITTLGRGGSDTTAVALASLLEAERCEIYSDFPGLFTADPRTIAGAVRVPRINHDEMLELATLGAKMLHYRAADIARKGAVPLLLLSSFEDSPGTIVEERTNMELPSIKSITSIPDVCALTATYELGDVEIDAIPELLEESGVQLIYYQRTRNGDRTTLQCLVEERDFDELAQAVRASGSRKLLVESGSNLSTVSVVGSGVTHKATVISSVEAALANAGIPRSLVWCSPLSVSCLIPRSECSRAVAVLHESFFPAPNQHSGPSHF